MRPETVQVARKGVEMASELKVQLVLRIAVVTEDT